MSDVSLYSSNKDPWIWPRYRILVIMETHNTRKEEKTNRRYYTIQKHISLELVWHLSWIQDQKRTRSLESMRISIFAYMATPGYIITRFRSQENLIIFLRDARARRSKTVNLIPYIPINKLVHLKPGVYILQNTMLVGGGGRLLGKKMKLRVWGKKLKRGEKGKRKKTA